VTTRAIQEGTIQLLKDKDAFAVRFGNKKDRGESVLFVGMGGGAQGPVGGGFHGPQPLKNYGLPFENWRDTFQKEEQIKSRTCHINGRGKMARED